MRPNFPPGAQSPAPLSRLVWSLSPLGPREGVADRRKTPVGPRIPGWLLGWKYEALTQLSLQRSSHGRGHAAAGLPRDPGPLRGCLGEEVAYR